MSIQATRVIWHNGELKPWAEAQVHVLTHALHYGSSVFEGIRVYDTPNGPRFFRLECHTRRFFESAKVYRMSLPCTREELDAVCGRVVVANELRSAYVRPIAFCGYGSLGVDPGDGPAELAVAAIDWGRYLGAAAIEEGVDVCVSSWQRVAPNTIPPTVKAGGNYLSSQLIHEEARRNGYAEGIGLATDGTVGEGSGENLFVVKNGVLHTPAASGAILTGITRDTVMTLADDLGLETVEGTIPRESLYLADEIFMTGTAAEITPVRSVDRSPIGDGARGPITKSVQDAFFGLFDGRTEDRWGWLREPRTDA